MQKPTKDEIARVRAWDAHLYCSETRHSPAEEIEFRTLADFGLPKRMRCECGEYTWTPEKVEA